MTQATPIKQPTRFICAVCDQPRPREVEGRPAYTKAGNGNLICFGCVNQQDQKDLDEGKGITLRLEWNALEGKWYAVNATGKIRHEVVPKHANMSAAQMLGAPMLRIKGAEWAGRLYTAHGTAFFTRLKGDAAKTAGGRSNGATVATTRAATKAAKANKPPANKQIAANQRGNKRIKTGQGGGARTTPATV